MHKAGQTLLDGLPPGPRAVPAHSAQEQASVLGKPELPCAVVAATSRAGSRSYPEILFIA
jgi:hypothetical protein